MRKLYFFLGVFLIFENAHCQEAMLPVGGNVKNTNGSASYSIGQVFYEQQQQTSGTIAEGVQHPVEILQGGVSAQTLFFNEHISVFPNPFHSHLTISFEHWFRDISIHVFDAVGREVAHLDMAYNLVATFDLSHLKPGFYSLLISSSSKVHATFVLVKNQ